MFLLRKMLIAATCLFLSTQTIYAMTICISANVVMIIIVFRKKPYLNTSALEVGEDHAERGKFWGVGTNNVLEIWMALGEIVLWTATLCNSAMGVTNEARVEEMATSHPFGNAICSILEWMGIIIFLMGAFFCLVEGLVVFGKGRTKILPTQRDHEEEKTADNA